jgi:hypothetical protein
VKSEHAPTPTHDKEKTTSATTSIEEEKRPERTEKENLEYQMREKALASMRERMKAKQDKDKRSTEKP